MLRAGTPFSGRAALVGAAALLGLPILGHAFIGLSSRYAADDYCTAGQLVEKGLLGMQATLYQGWSGRFSFTFIVGLMEMLGPTTAAVLPGLMVLAWVAALAWTISRFLAGRGLVAVVLAELIVVATLRTTPDVGQSVFWQTGLLTYLAPLVLVTLLVGLLRQAHNQGRWTPATAAIAALLALAAGGTSETYAAVQSVGLAVSIGLVLLLGGREARAVLLPLLISALAASLVALGIVLAAPGNAVRQQGNPTPNLGFAVRAAVEDAREFVRVFVRFSTPIAALVVALPAVIAFSLVGSDKRTSIRVRRVVTVLAIGVAAAILLVMFMAPSYYAISAPQPGRARIIAQALVVAAFAAGGWVAGRLLSPLLAGRDGVRWVASAAVAILLTGVALVSAWDVTEQTAQARDYAARWDAIDAQVRQDRERGVADVTVPPLILDGTIRGMDFVGPERADWLNECVARFYGIRTIAAPTR